jgi:hypothetical protein
MFVACTAHGADGSSWSRVMPLLEGNVVHVPPVQLLLASPYVVGAGVCRREEK